MIRRLLVALGIIGERTTSPRRPTRPRPPVDPPPEAVIALQRAMPHWLVMWSPSRRAWSAFARVPADPPIVDHPDTVTLMQRCRAAEMAAIADPPTAGGTPRREHGAFRLEYITVGP